MLSAEDRRKFDECCDRIHDIAFLEDYNDEELYEHDLSDQMDCIDGGNDATSDDDEMDVATDCETLNTSIPGAQIVHLSDERKEFLLNNLSINDDKVWSFMYQLKKNLCTNFMYYFRFSITFLLYVLQVKRVYIIEARLTWLFLRPVCKPWKVITLVRNILCCIAHKELCMRRDIIFVVFNPSNRRRT
jgi:hypothetical protein